MEHLMTIKDASNLWGISVRRISSLCNDGRIDGAVQKGRKWYIPANTPKPADLRIKTGAYQKTEKAKKLPLPIGISDYRLASTEYYYVDKTLMIRDFIDERPMSYRRWGYYRGS